MDATVLDDVAAAQSLPISDDETHPCHPDTDVIHTVAAAGGLTLSPFASTRGWAFLVVAFP
jgi:hypothetical protein